MPPTNLPPALLEALPHIAVETANHSRVVLPPTEDTFVLDLQRRYVPQSGDTERRDFSNPDEVYTIDGARYVWPKMRVRVEEDLVAKRPAVTLTERDGRKHLTVVFEEDVDQRAANTVPLPDVRVAKVQLRHGTQAEPVVLDIEGFEQITLSDPEGPAFRIDANCDIPDEQFDSVWASLRGEGGRSANWKIGLQFLWEQPVETTPDPPAPQPPPRRPPTIPHVPHRPVGPTGPRPRFEVADPRLRTPLEPLVMDVRPEARIAPGVLAGIRNFDLRDIVILDRFGGTRPTRPRTEIEAFDVERELSALYPESNPSNRAIYSAITGLWDGLVGRWQASPEGWFMAASLQQTAYILPDEFRLVLDPTSGLPAITATLLPGEDAGGGGTVAPRTRLTFHVAPHFDGARRQRMREVLRGESEGSWPYASLVFGGYAAAGFKTDDSLVGIGDLFAGESAQDEAGIDPLQGFTITYEGNAEFIAEIFSRLNGDREFAAIKGSVELDLEQSDGEVRKHPVATTVWMRRTTSMPVAVAVSPPTAVDGEEPTPWRFTITNPSEVEVTVHGASPTLLRVAHFTDSVHAAYETRMLDVTFPLQLPPGETVTIAVESVPEDATPNALDVEIGDTTVELAQEVMLDRIFDASTSGVPALSVEVTVLPFKFWDGLTPEQQEAAATVVAAEVEVRRQGSGRVETVSVDKDNPVGSAQLVMTVRDYLAADQQVGWEYRVRPLHPAGPGTWGDWTESFGTNLALGLGELGVAV